MASAAQAGGNTVINFGDGDQVTLIGVNKLDLGAADFII